MSQIMLTHALRHLPPRLIFDVRQKNQTQPPNHANFAMPFSYTKLAILLLRIQGVILILQSLPGMTMSLIALLTVEGMGRTQSYMWATFLQPVIGIILYVVAIPLAERAAGFLDRIRKE